MTGTLWLDERARALIEFEAIKRPRLETGGALFGYTYEDELVLACAYGPGPRARHRRTSFEPHPATTGLVMDAVREHSDRRYRYLGSWHTHPGAPARPSGQDIATTEAVAGEPDVLLARPLVVIQSTRVEAGGVTVGELRAWRWDPDADWVMPLRVEPCRLREWYCPVVNTRVGRRRANRTLQCGHKVPHR